MARSGRQVKGAGSYNAKLLWVGDTPGHVEEKTGIPFASSGAVGKVVRRFLEHAGLDLKHVRFNNAIPQKIPVPSRVEARAGLISHHFDHLEADLIRCKPKVIVACGAVALQRLTGLTNIMTFNGGVVPFDLPNGHRTLLIPCLHPSGVMRSKLQAEMQIVQRVTARAVGYALGHLKYQPRTPEVIMNPPADLIEEVLKDASHLIIDTEFNPDAQRLKLIGFTTNKAGPYMVYSITDAALSVDRREVLQRHLLRKDLTKVAHHAQADIESLLWAGLDSSGPWFDTLAVHSTLYPDLPCGLSHVARFYLNDVWDWKDMDKDDPVYNALDVANTTRILEAQHDDIAQLRMWAVLEQEVFPTLPLLWGLQSRGLLVDKKTLRKLVKRNRQGDVVGGSLYDERKGLQEEIAKGVEGLFAQRAAPLTARLKEIEDEIDRITTEQGSNARRLCKEHPTYTGLRKKRWTTAQDNQCTCQMIYEDGFVGGLRDRLAALRNEATKLKTKVKRWDRGFNPENNDHLRWLLYDKNGLHLPVQRNRERRPTANATAIAKLISLKQVQQKPEVVQLLVRIKRVQRIGRFLETFYRPPVDKSGYVHPPYRMRTGTGRPAGGDDPELREKGVSEYKFNALNIPNEVRQIYVPAPEPTVADDEVDCSGRLGSSKLRGLLASRVRKAAAVKVRRQVFVAADWINLEGRLTGYFSGDHNLNAMLEDELKGGHKVHARTAALLYNISPGDSKTTEINLQGQSVPAYDGGKRLRHLFHYGGKPPKMAQVFWISRKEAEEKYNILAETHPGVVAWWGALGDEVFGVHQYVCSRCETVQQVPGDCLACKATNVIAAVVWGGWAQEPTREHRTPFGRRRQYLGRRKDAMNALISQDPQSSGASMWYRVLQTLENWDGGSHKTLLVRRQPAVVTGTYDSFLCQCRDDKADGVLEWLASHMECAWPQLGGKRFPAELGIGYNWRKKTDDNPEGIDEDAVNYKPFSAQLPVSR